MPSSPEINQWNERWRSSPMYAQILAKYGLTPGPKLKASDAQRKLIQKDVEAAMGITFPKGVELDPALNMNEDEGFAKQAKKWGPIIAAGTVAAFGIPGVMPGLFGGVGTAAGSAAAGSASTGASAVGTAAKGGAMALGLSARDWIDVALFGGKTITDIAANRAQAGAIDRGTEAQQAANREALALLREQWETDRADFAPYLEAGKRSLGRIEEGMANYTPRPLPDSVERIWQRPTGSPAPMSQYGQAPVPPPAIFRTPSDTYRGGPDSGWVMPGGHIAGPVAATPPPAAPAPVPQPGGGGPMTPMSAFGQAAPAAQPVATAPGDTAPAGPGLVLLTAPDGSKLHVRPEKVAYYQQKWAQMGATA